MAYILHDLTLPEAIRREQRNEGHFTVKSLRGRRAQLEFWQDDGGYAHWTCSDSAAAWARLKDERDALRARGIAA